MKVLYTATVANHINAFHIPYLKLLREINAETCVAAKNNVERDECMIPFCNRYINIPFSRNPYSSSNFAAFRQLRKMICKEQFDLIHCHTPVASVLTRLAAWDSRRYRSTKVFYTAHGFHFYRGAPVINWIIYYPIERFCSRFTDVLITINREDYELAKKKMHARKVVYIPGVGIDLNEYTKRKEEANVKRCELGIPENATVLLSVGELNANKNHETLIRAVARIKSLYLIIVGAGPLEKRLQSVIHEVGVSDRVNLLGYRSDVPALCNLADLFVLPSHREGLSLALMEAMASGLPCVVSDIRGNRDLIDSDGGVLFDPADVEGCCQGIQSVLRSDMAAMGKHNMEKVQSFSLEKVLPMMEELYKTVLEKDD